MMSLAKRQKRVTLTQLPPAPHRPLTLDGPALPLELLHSPPLQPDSRVAHILAQGHRDSFLRVKVRTLVPEHQGSIPELPLLLVGSHLVQECQGSTPPDLEPLGSTPPDLEPLGSTPPDLEPLGSTPPDLEPLGSTQADLEPLGSTQADLEPLGSTQPPDLEPLGSTQPPDLEPLGSTQPPDLVPLGSTQPPDLVPLGSTQPPDLEHLGSTPPPDLEHLGSTPPDLEHLGSTPPDLEHLGSTPPDLEHLGSTRLGHSRLAQERHQDRTQTHLTPEPSLEVECMDPGVQVLPSLGSRVEPSLPSPLGHGVLGEAEGFPPSRASLAPLARGPWDHTGARRHPEACCQDTILHIHHIFESNELFRFSVG
ncbi:hypothetical protein DPEC_G00312340 [Dallia pectoralis]|uniref:Uncharacterized protein n=1 Tax=Dallia pectoralis TaxID=75939 RepID=A0ACC2FBJ9_DALPE|nr:hypothetical protein DPEC_G00312340 [Dallia pectoralis]